MSVMTAPAPIFDIANDYRSLSIIYWQKLVREGVPKKEAQALAKAIVKFELFAQSPSQEHKQLISRFSALLCRAQLWRSDLLL
ncbi:MAG: hypothetical protein AAGF98_14965 [Cyanobacteria bacterium P01_H01_bin.153]